MRRWASPQSASSIRTSPPEDRRNITQTRMIAGRWDGLYGRDWCHLVSCCCDFSKMLIPRPEISAEQLSKRGRNSFKWDFPPDEVGCAEQTVRGLHCRAEGWCRQAFPCLIPGEAEVNFGGEIRSLFVHIYATCLLFPNEPKRTGSTQTGVPKIALMFASRRY